MAVESLIAKIKNDISFCNARRVFTQNETRQKVIEEAAELITAIARGDRANTLEELCDVLIVVTRYFSYFNDEDVKLATAVLNSKLNKLNHITIEMSKGNYR